MKKNYKFYRNFAIFCGVIFIIVAVCFVLAEIKFWSLSPYSPDADTFRLLTAGALVFQAYLVYLVLGCYKRWKMLIRHSRTTKRKLREQKTNAEYTAFVNNYINF